MTDDDTPVDSAQTSRLPENMTVNLPKIQVMFEIENLDIHVPRMCLKSCLCARVEDVWSNKVGSRRNGLWGKVENNVYL